MNYRRQFFTTAVLVFALLGSAGCGDKSQPSATGSAQPGVAPKSDVKMVRIPAGEFIRGSNKVDDKGMKEQYGFSNDLYLDEHPQQKMYLDEFYIDAYEVSNVLYKEYILQTKRMMPFQWINNGYSLNEAQMQSMEVEKLRKLATDFFRLDKDTRVMDKPALIKAMVEQQQAMDRFPVGNVSWFDAKNYCEWRQARLPRLIFPSLGNSASRADRS